MAFRGGGDITVAVASERMDRRSRMWEKQQPAAAPPRLRPRFVSMSVIFMAVFITSLVSGAAECGCSRNPVMFNMGDSNSDTGGIYSGLGIVMPPPEGRAFFGKFAGRLSDGRLIIDFLCENLRTNYLTPYLESLGPNFTNGANFAISGSATLPRYNNINLGVQSRQFVRFQTRSIELTSKGFKGFVGEEDFKNALYMIDIGQNDLAGLFGYLPFPQVIQKIPTFIDEIKFSLWTIYQHGGRKFWVHNTGPFGCLPQQLGTTNKTSGDMDRYGCLQSRNDGAREFNKQLKALCEELRSEMKDATIVYVDIFAIKYDLIANSTLHGFHNPLTACCGHGGQPYNFDPDVVCGVPGFSVCEEGLKYVSWDGVHYTEAANAFVASKILSGDYSTPPLKFDFFCNA